MGELTDEVETIPLKADTDQESARFRGCRGSAQSATGEWESGDGKVVNETKPRGATKEQLGTEYIQEAGQKDGEIGETHHLEELGQAEEEEAEALSSDGEMERRGIYPAVEEVAMSSRKVEALSTDFKAALKEIIEKGDRKLPVEDFESPDGEGSCVTNLKNEIVSSIQNIITSLEINMANTPPYIQEVAKRSVDAVKVLEGTLLCVNADFENICKLQTILRTEFLEKIRIDSNVAFTDAIDDMDAAIDSMVSEEFKREIILDLVDEFELLRTTEMESLVEHMLALFPDGHLTLTEKEDPLNPVYYTTY